MKYLKTGTALQMKDESDLRMNHRRRRVEPFIHMVMDAIMPILDTAERDNPKVRRQTYDLLVDRLMSEGVEILTDHLRQEIGLPPRDFLGWTNDEIRAYEYARIAEFTKGLIPVTLSASQTPPSTLPQSDR